MKGGEHGALGGTSGPASRTPYPGHEGDARRAGARGRRASCWGTRATRVVLGHEGDARRAGARGRRASWRRAGTFIAHAAPVNATLPDHSESRRKKTCGRAALRDRLSRIALIGATLLSTTMHVRAHASAAAAADPRGSAVQGAGHRRATAAGFSTDAVATRLALRCPRSSATRRPPRPLLPAPPGPSSAAPATRPRRWARPNWSIPRSPASCTRSAPLACCGLPTRAIHRPC